MVGRRVVRSEANTSLKGTGETQVGEGGWEKHVVTVAWQEV